MVGANAAGARRHDDPYHAAMTERRALLLTDGHAGNRAQARALADAMGLAGDEPALALPAPWRWFAPRSLPGAGRFLPVSARAVLEPTRRGAPRDEGTYSLAIGCGRLGAWATARLRGQLFTAQILDPRLDPRGWDVVIAPLHDGLAGDNVITTLGALNSVTPARLAAAAIARPEFAGVPSPRTAVLVGGSTRAQRIDAGYIDALLQSLQETHAADGGGFLVTTSRRTGADALAALRVGLAHLPARIWAGERDGPNPYLAFLAHAQRIVVTPDSVNLASEACATGKPVYVHAQEPVRGKLARFHEALIARGHARPLAQFDPAWEAVPLRETQGVAEEVWRRMRAREKGPRA